MSPAKSKVQQRAAGMALSAKKGKTPKSSPKGAAKSMMSMTKKELEHMAGTPTKKLPFHSDASERVRKTNKRKK